MRKFLYIIFNCIIILGCATTRPKAKWFKEKAPNSFLTLVETNKGDFEIKIQRHLSPKAVDRFYQLVKHNYFDATLFYRVNPGFVAQFGGNNTAINNFWNGIKIPDEPVLQGNKRGTLSFARDGKNSRATDLFINLKNNAYLDTINYNEVTGFPSFGIVTKGMDIIDLLNDEYADTTMDNLELMYSNLNMFIEKYPELDTIYRVSIIK